jgi:hypothetical protein
MGVGRRGGEMEGRGGGDHEFLRARHDHFTYTPDGF